MVAKRRIVGQVVARPEHAQRMAADRLGKVQRLFKGCDSGCFGLPLIRAGSNSICQIWLGILIAQITCRESKLLRNSPGSSGQDAFFGYLPKVRPLQVKNSRGIMIQSFGALFKKWSYRSHTPKALWPMLQTYLSMGRGKSRDRLCQLWNSRNSPRRKKLRERKKLLKVRLLVRLCSAFTDTCYGLLYVFQSRQARAIQLPPDHTFKLFNQVTSFWFVCGSRTKYRSLRGNDK